MYDKVKALCDQKHISIAELERSTGIGNGTIGKWKESDAIPTLTTLKKIASYFKIPVSELID